VTATTAVGGTGNPALGSAPALSNDESTLYVAMDDSYGPYLVSLNATTLAPLNSVYLSVPNSGTSVYLINQSTAAPMIAPDGSVFMGVFANSYDGSRGFMTHYSADLSTEYTPGAFGWDDTVSLVPTSMVSSYTGTSPYLIFCKYNNYANAEVGSGGGNGINRIAILDPFATQPDPNNDPNPSLPVMKEIMTCASPSPDVGNINGGDPDAVREWCTNGTVVDPATDSVIVNNEDGYTYRWNLGSGLITQAVEITPGYGSPYTPTAIGPNGLVYSDNGGELFALGGYSNYTIDLVSSANPAVVGNSITWTTTVASTSNGPTPSGTVTYSYTVGANTPFNSTPITPTNGNPVTLVNGVASFTISGLAAAHYHVVATYNGDTTYAAGGKTTLVQPILVTTTTSLSASTNSTPYGGSVTFTATVTPDGTSFVPIGTVQFMLGNTLLGTASLNNLNSSQNPPSSNQASFTTSSLPAGIDGVTAVYNGDLNFAGSTSPVSTVTVGGTSTTLTDNGPNPSTFGQAVSFTATVSGGSAINGETIFIEDASNANAVVASPTLNGSTVTFTISNLSVGTHQLFAVYNGDTTHAGSNSSTAPVSQVVNGFGTAPSVTSVVVNGGAPQYTDSNGASWSLAGQNSVVEQLLVSFNEPVTVTAGAFTITNDAAGVNVISGAGPNTLPVTANAPIPVGGGPAASQWIVTFSGAGTSSLAYGGVGNVIKDGLYILNINASHVAASSGGLPMSANVNSVFWAMYGAVHDNAVSTNPGDGNSDVFIDANDFNEFRYWLNHPNIDSTVPAYGTYVPYDYDLDGFCDADTFNTFRAALNTNREWTF
jgi:hypothetical protein